MPPHLVASLYDAHAPALHRFLLSLCGSEADTRDLLQDLFLRILRLDRETLEDPQAFLFRSARNLFLDQLRRGSRRRRTLGDYEADLRASDSGPPEISDETNGAGANLAVARALACLPEEQRAVVHLKIWEKLTFARIAEILGIPDNTAASRYRYALERLRRNLPSHAPGSHAR